MKKNRSIYFKSIGISLIIDFLIIIYLFVIEHIYYVVNPYITDALIIVGCILFIYSAIFPVIYIIKVIFSLIKKKEKYSKKDIVSDFKLIIGSIIIQKDM